MKLSTETIKFRCWQLRQKNPDLYQKELARMIGCTVEELREAVPHGWRHGGAVDGAGAPASMAEVATDTLFAKPEHFYPRRVFRQHYVENTRGLF